MTCRPPNKDGESVTKVIHVIVTSCRPPEYPMSVTGNDSQCSATEAVPHVDLHRFCCNAKVITGW